MTPTRTNSDQHRPEIVYGKLPPEISYSAEHGILTINGCKISIEFLQHITASEPGIRFRIVERATDGAITIAQERSELEAAAPEMLAELKCARRYVAQLMRHTPRGSQADIDLARLDKVIAKATGATS